MTLWPVLFAFLPFVNLAARWAMPVGLSGGASGGAGLGVDVGAEGAGLGVGVVVEGMEVIDEWFPAGLVVWIAIGLALAILRVAHMSFS